jgi:hypothetical protein
LRLLNEQFDQETIRSRNSWIRIIDGARMMADNEWLFREGRASGVGDGRCVRPWIDGGINNQPLDWG